MDEREQQYERALRWYPRAWRARNGHALMADLMDQDDARGRTTPSPADQRALAVHGIGKRLSGGRGAAIAAVIIGAALVATAAIAPIAVFALLPGVTTTRFVGAVLLGAGLAALLLTRRSRGRSTRPVLGLAAAAGIVFLGACVLSLTGPDRSSTGTVVRDLGQFVPLGWPYAAYSTFGPALAVTAATTALCALGGLIALTATRHHERDDALVG